MTLYWRSQGKSLLQRLNELYETYGYYEDRTISKNFPGAEGVQTMKNIMVKLREQGLKSLAGKQVVSIRDVLQSVRYNPNASDKKETITLPKSNVLQFFLSDGTVVSARPSGTEPKIKFYINAVTPIKTNLADAKKESTLLCDTIEKEILAVLDEV